jgi:predicted ATPase/DNA-binding NarL/FixJ family response regulator
MVMTVDAVPPALAASPNNLPIQVTSFIGREREVAEVTRLLATTQLLTLIGAGGCGKTRLALHVASEVQDAYPDGVWLVELAPLADPALVARTVARTLGVHEEPGTDVMHALAEYLRTKELCLVIDNCEHLVTAAASLVDGLLHSCPHIRVLVTSREPLGVAGETVWRVPSLSVPSEPAAVESPDEPVSNYEAVRLFVDRALAARPGFAVTEQNAPVLAEICRRLDGIPLAIELAAARVRVFSLEQIAARLDDRFRLLTAGVRTALPRQQTLEATVDWSHNLLSEPERLLLRRLSVFAGDWSIEAAEAVAAGDGIETHAVLDLLAQLVDKSLVLTEGHQSVVRYRLIETIRQYAIERLRETAEEERMRDRHLAYFLAMAEEAEPKFRGAEDRMALQQLEEEHDNLRSALGWSLAPARPAETALRLSGALTWFWWLRSYHDEGCMWLARALAATPDRSGARMKALHGAGWLAHHRRDSAAARGLLRESLEIARALHDRWMEAWVLHALGRVAYFENDPATARLLGGESLAIAEEVGDVWLIAWALHLLGLAAHIEADYPAAAAYYERSLELRRPLAYHEGIAILLFLMGVVAVRQGDFERAHTFNGEAIEIMRTRLGPWSLAPAFAISSHLAATEGQASRAVRLGAAAIALQDRYHTPLIPLSEALLDEGLAIARQALDEGAYATAVEEGRAMSLDAAVAEALAVEEARAIIPLEAAAYARAPGRLPGLTDAETHVLSLLTTGRTSREIAAELVVAISTVDRHLTHIYQKLGVRNRAEAIAAVMQQSK